MKGRITIEVDFENGNSPVIQILQYPDSTDVRDKLIKHFTEMIGGSSWCRLQFKDGISDHNVIHISPIPPLELKKEANIMLEQYRLHQDWLEKHEKIMGS